MRLHKLIVTLALVGASGADAQQADRYNGMPDRYPAPQPGSPTGGAAPNSMLPAVSPTGPMGGNPAPIANPGAGGAMEDRNLLRDFNPSGGTGGAGPAALGNDLQRAQPMNAGSGSVPAAPTNQRPYTSPAPNTHTETAPYGSGGYSNPNVGFTSSTTAADTTYAEDAIKSALTAPPGSRLSGTKVYLSEVVAAGGSRSEQSEAIGAYWDLCSAVADYYLAMHEEGELVRLGNRLGQMTLPMREAQKKLITRRDTSLVAAQASQLRLAALMRRGDIVSLPLPGDMPLCAVYHTRYSQNFPNGGSREAAELNKLLPLRHVELLDAASNVKESEEWFRTVAGRDVNDQGAGMIKGLELLALNRRAFVQIARDYNRRIARYTELARPGQVQTDRLVAMLIKTNNLANRNAAPASPNPGSRGEAGPPTTFQNAEANPLRSAPPRLDDDVQPTGGSIPVAGYVDPREEPAMVEKITPGERSVLIRRDQE